MKTRKVVRMPLRRAPQRPRPPAGTPLRARAATADEAYDEEEDYDGEEEPNMNFWHAVLVVLVLHFIAVAGIFSFNWIKANQTADTKVTAPAKTAPAPQPAESAAPPPAAAASKPVEKPKAPDASIAGWTGKTYTIQPRDTLIRVSTQFGVSVSAIEKENNLPPLATLHVGQVLKIPAPGSEKTASTARAEAPVAKPASGTIASVPKSVVSSAKTETAPVAKPSVAPKAAPAAATETADVYVIVKGDNPYTIAKKLHVSYQELLDLNDIKDATKIQIGQKLKIPKKTN